MQAEKIMYLHNPRFPTINLGEHHPMKPLRVDLTEQVLQAYEVMPDLRVFHSREATKLEMLQYHDQYYLSYLQSWVSPHPSSIVQQIAPQLVEEYFKKDTQLGERFNVNQGEDCPGFSDLYSYCKLAAGSSLDAADLLTVGESQVVVNWMGGHHHARKAEAAGFCYVNDIVLCILELLKACQRVMYVDIDVHHGDAVEKAFEHTNRVMTVSFHQFEPQFFPETGSLKEVGTGKGRYFSINVPLKRGIDDLSYYELFRAVMDRAVDSFRPQALVVQCGADSLARDNLGGLNLSIEGHASCLKYMKGLNLPMVVLGGGGYTIENVSRCWAYETAMLAGVELEGRIPPHKYSYYYQFEEQRLLFEVEQKPNLNSRQQLQSIHQTVVENLRRSEGRPGVGLHYVPRE